MNNKSIFRLSAIVMAFSLLFSACKKDEGSGFEPDTFGTLQIEFDHKFGEDDLELDRTYTNAAGEEMTFSMVKYFISNIKLVKEDNSELAIPGDVQYFLVDQSKLDSRKISIPNVPTGSYKSIKFVVGVDSLANTLEVADRPAALDVAGNAAGMYWSWNSGYIFMKVEGTSPASTQEGGGFKFHIGGFGGYTSSTLNNIKEVECKRTGDMSFSVLKDSKRELHMVVSLDKMFSNPNAVSMATNSVVMGGAFSQKIAENYATMFKLDHIH